MGPDACPGPRFTGSFPPAPGRHELAKSLAYLTIVKYYGWRSAAAGRNEILTVVPIRPTQRLEPHAHEIPAGHSALVSAVATCLRPGCSAAAREQRRGKRPAGSGGERRKRCSGRALESVLSSHIHRPAPWNV